MLGCCNYFNKYAKQVPHQKNELRSGFRESVGNLGVQKWGNGPQVGAMPQQRTFKSNSYEKDSVCKNPCYPIIT
jgi:carbamate kinase